MRGPIPSSVCVRVTRGCNARCGFCLAPPDGQHVPFDDLVRGLEWLAALGVRKIQLCGGEPTIRRDLPEIVQTVGTLGFVCALTTNGILLRPALLDSLRAVRPSVKVSLHGPPSLHDEMLGRECYERVVRNIETLQGAGVPVGIQTISTRRCPDAFRYTSEFCLDRGLGKLTVMPFVPRGRGVDTADDFQLSPAQKATLVRDVRAARRRLAGRLDIRLVDLWTRDYYVVETNGELTIQRETDAADTSVAQAW